MGAGRTIGDTAASIKVIEFADFECPYCKKFDKTMHAITAHYGLAVSRVFVELPLRMHRFAVPAARAAECAASQGRFAEIHDVLFGKQDSLGLKSWLSYVPGTRGFLDTARFVKCIADTARIAAVDRGIALARKLGLTGTPTVILERMDVSHAARGVDAHGNPSRHFGQVVLHQSPLAIAAKSERCSSPSRVAPQPDLGAGPLRLIESNSATRQSVRPIIEHNLSLVRYCAPAPTSENEHGSPTPRSASPHRVNACRRRPRALTAAVVLTAVIACGDPYLHTNPYDPAHPVEFTITGPDTLFSVGEIAQYTVQTNLPWSDTGLAWAIDTLTDPFIVPPPPPLGCGNQVVSGDTILRGNGSGAYQSLVPPLEPYAFNIAIEVWLGSIDTTLSDDLCVITRTVQTNEPRHIGYKTVVVTQRVTRIQLRCPDTHACAPLAVGDLRLPSSGSTASTRFGRQIAALTEFHCEPEIRQSHALQHSSSDPAIQRALATNNPGRDLLLNGDSTIAGTTPIGFRRRPRDSRASRLNLDRRHPRRASRLPADRRALARIRRSY